MLDLEARRRNVRERLAGFLGEFCGGGYGYKVDKTRRKFFRQAVGAVVMSSKLVVSRWCRWVHDNCRERFYRQKRLLNQLHSADWDHAPVLRAYQQWAGRFVQPDTPLLLDLTDLAKPRARKLKYLAYVRDGSDPDHRLVPGYWCVQVYARGWPRTAPCRWCCTPTAPKTRRCCRRTTRSCGRRTRRGRPAAAGACW